ncbi:glyoxalase [Enterovibrio norvegicus]|uniref:VOC family protein n=1 Tax=Enterovibrio norvegicus TaxID=188144 RepID=UPI0002E509A2|nr:VOC family protein [Enterovibrio norvegicus]OEF48733.1 glyoxalase [Enterovibrio norvegicus]
MKFKYTILYVEDVAATLAFYENAFGMKTAMLHESGDYGELSSGDTTLSFSSLALMAQLGKNPSRGDGSAPCFEIAFETEEVEKSLNKATAAGAVLVQDVKHMPWGQTTAYVKDLNGFLVEICSSIQAQ